MSYIVPIDSRIISNLLHRKTSLIKKTCIGSKMTRFQKYEKWPFSNILTKALSSKAKLPKMVDFVDEIEINKITIQTQHKSFQSRSRLFFHGLQKSLLD